MDAVYPTLDQFRRAAMWKERPAELAEKEFKEFLKWEARKKEIESE